MNPARITGVALLIFVAILMAFSGTYAIQPGYRGVEVIMGKVTSDPKKEGFGLKLPLVTTIYHVSVRQQTEEAKADCYSSDLQQVHIELRVLFRIPETSVVTLFRDYEGFPFETLISPRIHEALKEVTALQSAEQIVKNREEIKARALALAKEKIGSILVVEDIVIQNIQLTKELEHAIEAKMVQDQEAQRSKFVKDRAQIEANTAVIKARGEAESIQIRGQALKENPTYVELQIIDRWDGVPPLVIGRSEGLMMPLSDLEQRKRNAPTNSLQPAARRPNE